MIYPRFIRPGDIIGITSPSDGIGDDPAKNARMDSAERQFERRGYRTIETGSVRKSVLGRSADAETRAREFMSLIEDPECSLIMASGGGDWLFEMLPYLDYKKIAENPKWFEGMSDPTGICYTMTTLSDVATVYGVNASSFGMEVWDESLDSNFSILEGRMPLLVPAEDGKKIPTHIQKNGKRYQSSWLVLESGTETYNKDARTRVKLLFDGKEIVDAPEKKNSDRDVFPEKSGSISVVPGKDSENNNKRITAAGRMLGGCMDVLVQLCGTRFDGTKDFIKKYEKDGIIWYLEVFSMTPEVLASYLWKFKEAGWFDTAKAFIFGRPCMINDEYSNISYEEALLSVLAPLGKPVITGLDIGHRPPAMAVVNGAVGEILYENGEFYLSQTFRQ